METNKHSHMVIMAGGIGSRFWPMSTPQCPKQFIDVLGCGRTLLQLTVDRFKGIVQPDNIWVVTGENYKEIVAEQLPDIPESHILLEPCRRGTAPCICYAAWRIKTIDPKACLVVTPSDHIVMNIPEFHRVVQNSLVFAKETDGIITLGIKPTRPDTGYGYIQADMSIPSSRNKEIFRVDKFCEKPNLETAKEFVSKNIFFWNAGIFVMSVSTIVNAFRIYEPQTNEIFEGMQKVLGTKEEINRLKLEFPKCNNISIDYAIMERAEEIFVFPAEFGWSDLGTWGSLQQQIEKDIYNNAVVGDNIRMFESNGCIVHTKNLNMVIVQGLDNYIIAEHNGKLLICKQSEEQRIGKMSEI